MEWPGFELRSSSIRRGCCIHSTTPHLAGNEKWGMRTGVLTRESSINFIFANFSVVEPMFKTTEDGKMVARNREPIQNFEAIYFICPTEQAVDALISDFEEPNNFRNSENLYKSAHIYFTTGS